MPVGYEKIVDMYPLDFEEFLWANGISDNIIDEIRKHFNEETPVPDGLHVPLNDLFRKYAADEDKARIRECFESIPRQLAKENKKFQYSVVKKGGRSSEYISCLQWIEDVGIIKRCYNTCITELPLDGNAINDYFRESVCRHFYQDGQKALLLP